MLIVYKSCLVVIPFQCFSLGLEWKIKTTHIMLIFIISIQNFRHWDNKQGKTTKIISSKGIFLRQHIRINRTFYMFFPAKFTDPTEFCMYVHKLTLYSVWITV